MSEVNVYIKIKTTDSPEIKIYKKLNLEKKLFDIREKHEIDDTLSFSTKVGDDFFRIGREDENFQLLKDIVEEIDDSNYYLHLEKSEKGSRLSMDWKILNVKRSLDYGRTMSFDGMKIANKISFKIKDCELKTIGVEGDKKGRLKFKSREDWMRKTNLFFSTDINVHPVGLGILIGKLKNKIVQEEVESTYRYSEIGKASLKLSKENLEPTSEFINLVHEAIKSKNPREEFQKIIEEYGQIIPTEFILGGRAYYKEDTTSSTSSQGNSKGGSVKVNTGPISAQAGGASSHSKSKSEFYSFDQRRFLGGKLPDVENSETETENAWAKSLDDYRNWDCIEFKKPISIFQLLPDDLPDDLRDLRKRAFKSIGKRILYTSTEDCYCHSNLQIFKLPQHILKIIQNEEAECNIFAAVIDTEDSKNVFFNCQIHCPPDESPEIIIHCIQKKPKRRDLKIKIMIIGYDTDFSFILSDVSVELIEGTHNSQNQQFHSIPLQRELRPTMEPFLGIPVLNDLNLNKPIVIGHTFRKDKIDIFSYCMENKRFVDLPNFTFYTLIVILKNPNPDTYESFPFKFDMLRNPYIDLKRDRKQNSLDPKYISLYLSIDNDYKPVFLKQKFNQISLRNVDCKCKGNCSICKRTKKISKNDKNSCMLFDPKHI